MVRKAPPAAPWAPEPVDIADLSAIQAIAQGIAEPQQQIRALKWIVERLCRTYDLSYRAASDRDTVFAEGKRYVGLQIVKLTKLNPQLLKDKTNG